MLQEEDPDNDRPLELVVTDSDVTANEVVTSAEGVAELLPESVGEELLVPIVESAEVVLPSGFDVVNERLLPGTDV